MGRFTRAYRAIALVWLNFCVLFLIANVVGEIVIAVRNQGDGLAAVRESQPAFVRKALELSYPDLDESERADLWRASGIGFRRDPLVGFREKVVSGKYVNVDPNGFGIGKDQGPWPIDDENYNIFLLGGSTAFGYGVPDDLTISSQLQGMLSDVGGRPTREEAR